jgi:hypothetical protein
MPYNKGDIVYAVDDNSILKFRVVSGPHNGIYMLRLSHADDSTWPASIDEKYIAPTIQELFDKHGNTWRNRVYELREDIIAAKNKIDSIKNVFRVHKQPLEVEECH